MPAIQAENIVKRYGKKKEAVTALHGISITVEKDEIFGIIGPDGAGKTSLFRILTTLLLPDGGQASVNGMDVVKDYARIRQQIGYMPGKFSLTRISPLQRTLNSSPQFSIPASRNITISSKISTCRSNPSVIAVQANSPVE